MSPEDFWGNLADFLRAVEPDIEAKIAYCRSHLPDPARQPVNRSRVGTERTAHRVERAAHEIISRRNRETRTPFHAALERAD